MVFTHIPVLLERSPTPSDKKSLRNFRLTKRWHYKVPQPAFAAAHFTTLDLDFERHRQLLTSGDHSQASSINNNAKGYPSPSHWLASSQMPSPYVW